MDKREAACRSGSERGWSLASIALFGGYHDLEIEKGGLKILPRLVPSQHAEGVVARKVEGRTLYVNTGTTPATVNFEGTRTGALSHRTYSGKIVLPPYGVELVE